MYAIEVQQVVKTYKNGVRALNEVNLKVKKGEIFTLLGPNGAGKSTLIKLLTTYLKPTSGIIHILDKDISSSCNEIRLEIAYVSQQTSIDTHLSLEENMMFQSQLYRIPKAEAKDKMENLINELGLSQYRNYPISSYSGGVKRRLDIALNLMSNPKILFLDEPTVGMDIQSRRSMWEMVKNIRDKFNTTIFLTTHYLEEANNLSDTICIMKDGKDIVQGSPFELRSFIKQDSLQIDFTTKNDVEKHFHKFKNLFSDSFVFTRNTSIGVISKNNHSDMKKAFSLLLKQDIFINGIQIMQPTLEDVFLRLTTNEKMEDIL